MPSSRPNAGPKTFSCDDGSALAISISASGQADIAKVVLSDGSQQALIGVPSTVGRKFSNGQATLLMNGNTAQLATGSASRFCVAQ